MYLQQEMLENSIVGGKRAAPRLGKEGVCSAGQEFGVQDCACGAIWSCRHQENGHSLIVSGQKWLCVGLK